MSILSQYLMRTIISSTALVLVVLLAIAGLFEFIAELSALKERKGIMVGVVGRF